MTDNDYNRILSAAEEFAERTAKNMPYKDMIAEVYRNGAILEHNHLCKWHNAEETQPGIGEKVLVKLANGDYAIGIYRTDNLWYLAGSGVLPSNEHISWRYIID